MRDPRASESKWVPARMTDGSQSQGHLPGLLGAAWNVTLEMSENSGKESGDGLVMPAVGGVSGDDRE